MRGDCFKSKRQKRRRNSRAKFINEGQEDVYEKEGCMNHKKGLKTLTSLIFLSY